MLLIPTWSVICGEVGCTSATLALLPHAYYESFGIFENVSTSTNTREIGRLPE